MPRLIRFFIRIYQYALSPWLGVRCRFTPTCSHYACEAIEQYGATKGVGLAVKRLVRCHPWGGSGFDAVPTKIGKEMGYE